MTPEEYSKSYPYSMRSVSHKEDIVKGYKCPKCGRAVYKTDTKGYFAQCFYCDEYFYKFELENYGRRN